MSTAKRIGLGCTLGCDPAGGTAYAVLGAIVDGFDGPDAKAKQVNTSLLSDVYETFARASIDSGEVSFTICYSPEDTATTTVLTALLTSGAIAGWQVTMPALGTFTVETEHFSGFVANFKRSINKEKMIEATVGVKVSGPCGFTGA